MKSEVGSVVVSLKKGDRLSELRKPASIAAPHPARRAFGRPIGKQERAGWELPVSLNAMRPGTAGPLSEITVSEVPRLAGALL